MRYLVTTLLAALLACTIVGIGYAQESDLGKVDFAADAQIDIMLECFSTEEQALASFAA